MFESHPVPYYLGIVRKLRHALGGRGVEDFVTVQTKNLFLHTNFVTRGGGGFKKFIFLRTTPYSVSTVNS